MKFLVAGLVAMGIAILAAPVAFKTVHEFTGMRSILEVWEPDHSLAIYDFMTGFVDVLEASDFKNASAIEEKFRIAIEKEQSGIFARALRWIGKHVDLRDDVEIRMDEYNNDLDSRWNALTPTARKLLEDDDNKIGEFLYAKMVSVLVELDKQPKEVKDDLKSSFPALFGYYEKLRAGLKEDI